MLIEIDRLELSLHHRRILAGVNLHMQPGDIYGLLGPNGAGKSTTMSVLNGLRRASSGSVSVLGMDPWTQRRDVHRQIGVLPEQAGFYDWMSAQDYLLWFAELYGRALAAGEIASHLAQVGLDAKNADPIGTYSRGMKQRLGLARALLNRPKLLVLDEPTNGLDPRGRREIHDMLLGLARENGVGVLLCTHLLDDVDRLCTRIGVLNQGKTVVEGSLSELLASRQAALRYRLRLLAPPPRTEFASGIRVVAQEGQWWHLDIGSGVSPQDAWRELLGAGWAVSEIHREGGGLEDLYLNLTTTEAAA
ncbi:ABC transporter ATP-binding protein [Thiobacillus sedimenti]|uniref:ABC transporter ATP-binding protein n=1 Tax=Thiobacillus sedimenti TaxID=3110231 RepID=A0ABZ1CMI8_9PROT|nr:ABC transporter ATP-binding protein [Thiobacillus sp. SCUT-2]WRS40618.1 ABC transporter ATP-binding protein [Thiobacillus sp. SCUT-2]